MSSRNKKDVIDKITGTQYPDIDTKRDAYIATYRELHSEIRAYRQKEYQTFVQSIPLVTAPYIFFVSIADTLAAPTLLQQSATGDFWETVLHGIVTVFVVYLLFRQRRYIKDNLIRMDKIKEEIVSLQIQLGVKLQHLKPLEWASKQSLDDHLGTSIYYQFILGEIVVVLAYFFLVNLASMFEIHPPTIIVVLIVAVISGFIWFKVDEIGLLMRRT